MPVFTPCVFNLSCFESGLKVWCGRFVVQQESFMFFAAVVSESAVALWLPVDKIYFVKSWTFPYHIFCAWRLHHSCCFPSPSLPLAEICIYKQFTCPSDTQLLSFKPPLSPLHSFSTCRHSWLRASLNVQVVMTTMSAALNTTLRIWRSSHTVAHLHTFNAIVILQTNLRKQLACAKIYW